MVSVSKSRHANGVRQLSLWQTFKKWSTWSLIARQSHLFDAIFQCSWQHSHVARTWHQFPTEKEDNSINMNCLWKKEVKKGLDLAQKIAKNFVEKGVKSMPQNALKTCLQNCEKPCLEEMKNFACKSAKNIACKGAKGLY